MVAPCSPKRSPLHSGVLAFALWRCFVVCRCGRSSRRAAPVTERPSTLPQTIREVRRAPPRRSGQVQCSQRSLHTRVYPPRLGLGLLKPRCLIYRERSREELIAEGRIVDWQTLVELL